MTTVLQARPRRFVSTPSVERVATRALRYLQSGFSVHLRGPAGTGKTTLALHLADLLSRPIMLIFGDDEFKTSDLIGNQTGYTRKKVVDNYIHSVVKVEDELRQNWVDSRLTLACREGFTLVYDEFNRSRPEVNNVLLSALEEKLLVLPPSGNRNEYIRVNPHFRAIFTSNPEEYCGVHETQDALLDRLITINMPEPDELTQQEIVVQKTGIDRESAAIIVSLVKAFRIKTGAEKTSGLRSCLMVGKVCHEHEILVMPENPEFRDICHDVLLSRTGRSLAESTQLLWELFNELICPELDPADLLEDCDLSQPETLIFSPQSQAHPEVEVLSGELTKQSALPNGNKQDESNLEIDELSTFTNTESSVPFEWEVYEYLQEFQDARIAQIEAALGINRYQVVTALRSLTEQGIQFNSSIAETISAYQIHITSEDEV
ncbi:gas vesicle protein GvpN [Cyanobacteria bacterium FACHB-471]|nr:gas vesicle protein GvpN [Cyanobacteria bacterium FACHB-471]